MNKVSKIAAFCGGFTFSSLVMSIPSIQLMKIFDPDPTMIIKPNSDDKLVKEISISNQKNLGKYVILHKNLDILQNRGHEVLYLHNNPEVEDVMIKVYDSENKHKNEIDYTTTFSNDCLSSNVHSIILYQNFFGKMIEKRLNWYNTNSK